MKKTISALLALAMVLCLLPTEVPRGVSEFQEATRSFQGKVW